MCNLVDAEPTYFEEDTKKKQWMDAMIEEYQSILKNDVLEVVPRPRQKPVVSSKWIFKKKYSAHISIKKYKEIFVAQGFLLKQGNDYEETFALVAIYTSIRTVLALESKI